MNVNVSDHEIVVLATVSNLQCQVDRKKKTIVTRLLPESQINVFEGFLKEWIMEDVSSKLDIGR